MLTSDFEFSVLVVQQQPKGAKLVESPKKQCPVVETEINEFTMITPRMKMIIVKVVFYLPK